MIIGAEAVAPDHPSQRRVVAERHSAIAHQQHGCRKAVSRKVDSVVVGAALSGYFGSLSDDYQPFGALIARVGVGIHTANQRVVSECDGRCFSIGEIASTSRSEQV